MNCYVYQLVDPRTNRPFYIGKGSGDRAQQHMKEARRDPTTWINKIKCQIINNIERMGRNVVVEILHENLSDDEAYQIEEQLVRQYGKLIDGTGCLSNIADGGEGGSGNLGRTIQSYTITGAVVNSYKTLSEAANDLGINKSTICAALNGRSSLAGGYRWGYDGELPLEYKSVGTPVDQYTIDGRFMCTHERIKDVADTLGIVPSVIVDCCKGVGNAKTAGGYRWAYAGELPPELPDNYRHRPKGRRLQSINVDGHIIKEYSSIKEAVADTKANATGISDCCAGRKKTSGGLSWRWVT